MNNDRFKFRVYVSGRKKTYDVVSIEYRWFNHKLENFERKISFERFFIDCNGTITRFHVHACNSSFPTSYGVYNFHSFYLISFNLMVLGFCAACGCSAPA